MVETISKRRHDTWIRQGDNVCNKCVDKLRESVTEDERATDIIVEIDLSLA